MKHEVLLSTKRRYSWALISIATLKKFLSKLSKDKVKEVCIDMKEALWKVVETLSPKAKSR